MTSTDAIAWGPEYVRRTPRKRRRVTADQQCCDCGQFFRRHVKATKQRRCSNCAPARAKAVLAATNRRSYLRYKTSPPPCWRKSGRAA